ncbi:phosphotransferase [Consotaella salsifontis]|uniref:Phosphotransferase enzyme family protein n=1 Tax=Consotaella salsifontis TaxID=1365950 RepID=A0A1T4LHX8_9HYPH|nr:aminoglycoside phosphotransferase family protein [Consotaella salsifontis]SJZ54313.1 Phosphotransferase enzyme family protein [Consotaella salsifontis]
MADGFVDLAADEDAARLVLERMGLLERAEAFSVEPLAGGVSSNVLKISRRGETFCLKQALPKLKVSKDWQAPIERVFSEIDWLTVAGAIVPEAVPAIRGIDRETGCFAMDFLPAEDHANWKTLLLAGTLDMGFANSVGRVLGCIHQATANDAGLAAQFANDANFDALRLDPYLGETERQNPDLADEIKAVRLRTRETRRALVHGDVSPKNILSGPRGPVLLDAECAWYGDPAFDLAFCLNHLLLKSVRDPARAEALLQLFDAFVAAYFSEVSFEPAPELEKRTAHLLACLLLARVDGKSPVEYLDDDQRARLRSLARELVRQMPSSLQSFKQSFEGGIRS